MMTLTVCLVSLQTLELGDCYQWREEVCIRAFAVMRNNTVDNVDVFIMAESH